ncbi:MAG TPA: NAD(+)/NADH kinase [Solirubrobacteraceae bacterium]
MSDLRRVALVVHPTREIGGALATLGRWAAERELEVVQLAADGARRQVAPAGTVGAADLVVALGGDGTTLTALRAAASTETPVLGVACGSLGAMSAVTGDELGEALDRFRAGNWRVRSLPAIAVASNAGAEWAVNDVVLVRRGPGQIAAHVAVDGELYARMAGDGVIVATPLGSSAYSMASGGPILAAGTPAYLLTPLAIHGGSAPPLVIPGEAELTIDIEAGYAGFDVEIDGRQRTGAEPRYRFTLHPGKLSLVTFAGVGRGLAGLRDRGIITDSPRILARDARAAREKG